VEGVVITFTDITARKQAAKVLEAAKQEAELANVAKSRFLAAASHDLRQPLQALALIQGILTTKAEGQATQKLVALMAQTLGAMSGMLNTLLDINQIDSGTVQPDIADFRIDDMLQRLQDEFGYHAQAQSLELRTVLCRYTVTSDRQLLEQMMRNLLSNAMKYTKRGRVLLGCRRHGGMLSVEVWDTGIGIPDTELGSIFREYHQVDNAARERSRGLGLGLSIVERLATLLDHKVSVRSQLGKGSVFAIEVPLGATSPKPRAAGPEISVKARAAPAYPGAAILVAEDDPELRALIHMALKEHGHRSAVAANAKEAQALVARGAIRPDIILADYNLPNGISGLELAVQLRSTLGRDIPVIILTADLSTATLREIAAQNCKQLNKPVKLPELTAAIAQALAGSRETPRAPHPSAEPPASTAPIIFVVDDDIHIRDAVRAVLEDDGREVRDFATCEAFLDSYCPGPEACLVLDANLPGMGGLDLLSRLHFLGRRLPTIMITGNSDVTMAVQAMKAGASDLIEKPIGRRDLLASIERALEQSRDAGKLSAWRASAAEQLVGLTARQRQVMELVLAGQPSKNIAADLGISQRTVENHRASIMHKTGSKSLPALARMALAAASHVEDA
jgi:two-component system CheB/CheR fusion protein